MFDEIKLGWRHHPAGRFEVMDFLLILDLMPLDGNTTPDHALAGLTPPEAPTADHSLPAVTIAPPSEPIKDHNMPVVSCATRETTSKEIEFDFVAATRDTDPLLAADYQELMNDDNK